MKNFFVATESVKGRDGGLATYQSYLNMKEHPNHKNKTTAIYDIFNGGKSGSAFQNILLDTFNYEANEGERRMREGIRGRYKLDSFAQSFVLSVPKINEMNEHIRPTPEQWKKIFTEVVLKVGENIVERDKNRFELIHEVDANGNEVETKKQLPRKYPELTAQSFARVCFANVHEQKEGNDHLNIIIGKMVKGCVIKELTQRCTIETMKNEFTKSLAKHCGLTLENYKPVNTKPAGKRRKVAAEHTIFNREYKKQMVEEFGKELIKPFQNYVNNIEKERFEKAGQWLNDFEVKRSELFENNANEFGLDGAFAMDERLMTAISSATLNAELKQAPVPDEKPKKLKRDKNGTIIGFVDE
jgi:hypothetical protein